VSCQNQIYILTGLSGAGRSLFLRALEDLGCETIDNLPLHIAQSVILKGKRPSRPLAINFDLRSHDFSPDKLLSLIKTLRAQGLACELVFLESQKDILHKRYRQTRRYHPLSTGMNLRHAILKEKKVLAPLREEADFVLDTSLLTPPELIRLVRRRFHFDSRRELFVEVISFAFNRGLPADANFVFDMRFLKNPYYEPGLQGLTGQDPLIQEYIQDAPLFETFFQNLLLFLDPVLSAVREEGRGSFILAFGCSGGRHRSVVASILLGRWLEDKEYQVYVTHRELDVIEPK
jgi:UPF0042 nucleotide-binding protein